MCEKNSAQDKKFGTLSQLHLESDDSPNATMLLIHPRPAKQGTTTSRKVSAE
jgi:hypothetical protein